jgi:hypothetical protein
LQHRFERTQAKSRIAGDGTHQFRFDIVFVVDFLNQPDPQRLVGADRYTAEQQTRRLSRAHHLHEPVNLTLRERHANRAGVMLKRASE